MTLKHQKFAMPKNIVHDSADLIQKKHDQNKTHKIEF